MHPVAVVSRSGHFNKKDDERVHASEISKERSLPVRPRPRPRAPVASAILKRGFCPAPPPLARRPPCIQAQVKVGSYSFPCVFAAAAVVAAAAQAGPCVRLPSAPACPLLPQQSGSGRREGPASAGQRAVRPLPSHKRTVSTPPDPQSTRPRRLVGRPAGWCLPRQITRLGV